MAVLPSSRDDDDDVNADEDEAEVLSRAAALGDAFIERQNAAARARNYEQTLPAPYNLDETQLESAAMPADDDFDDEAANEEIEALKRAIATEDDDDDGDDGDEDDDDDAQRNEPQAIFFAPRDRRLSPSPSEFYILS